MHEIKNIYHNLVVIIWIELSGVDSQSEESGYVRILFLVHIGTLLSKPSVPCGILLSMPWHLRTESTASL